VVVDAAVVPERPVAPKKKRSVLLGLLLGLAAGLQLAFLIERIRDEVKYEEDLKRATRLPNLAVIPDYKWEVPPGGSFATPSERFSPKHLINNPLFQYAYYRESFKVLRTNLTFARVDEPLKAMAVLSPGPEEGKTLVSADLALAVAETGKRTLLVDADMRKPSVAKMFGLSKDKETGLPLALTGAKDWKGMVVESGAKNLWLLPNFFIPPNPAELMGSDAMRKLVAEMRNAYDCVLFDGAPVLPVTDRVVLSSMLDGVILMARFEMTHSADARRALEHLNAVHAKVLGTLLNAVDFRRKLYGYGKKYGYRYKYGYKYYRSDEKEQRA
jgi:succinoglycan biosynthesis transport protein ExoP